MRIRRLEISAFGRFRNVNLGLGPGLNVIYGPNEAGKSTLLRFIQGMLYGLQKPGLMKRSPLPELQRLMPWDGTPARGSLLYETSDGRSYRVEREFGPRGFARLYDAATGEELTSRYPTDQRKELLFAEAQLGLSDAEFAATACIGQMEARFLVRDGGAAQTQELTTRLANLVAGGQEDVSMASVLRLLNDALSEIGAPGRDSTKPLAEAGKRVQRLEAALDQARRVREENLGKERRLRDLRAEIAQLGAEVELLRRLRDSLRRRELGQRREHLRGLRRRLAEAEGRVQALAAYAGFPAEHRDEVTALAQGAAGLERREREAAAEVELIGRRRQQAEEALQLFAPLDTLGPDAEVQVSQDFVAYSRNLQDRALRQERLKELRHQLQDTEGRLQDLGPLATEGAAWEVKLERLDEQAREAESQLSRLAQSRPELRARLLEAGHRLKFRQRLAAIAAAALAVLAALPAFLLGRPALSALALLALPLWLALRRPPASALEAHQSVQQALEEQEREARRLEEETARCQAEKASLLAQSGASSAAEFKVRLREARGLAEARDRDRAEAGRLETDLAHIDASLRVLGGTLAEAVTTAQEVAAAQPPAASDERSEAGFNPAVPGAAAAATGAVSGVGPGSLDPLSLGEAHIRQFRQVWAAYRRAREEAADLDRQQRQAERALAERRREREEAGQRLASLLQAAGVSDLEAYEASHRGYLAYQEALQARSTARQVLEAALVEGDEEDLDRELLALGPEREVPQASAGETESAQELTQRLTLLTARLSARQADARGLEGEIEQAYRGLDVAALEVELEEATAEHRSLEERRWVLEQARNEIQAAAEQVHREFAPRLNRVASAAIARITGGRYREVHVDQQLGLRVVVPETGQLRPVEDLSGGSLDQFYLALRLGMADLLTGGREPVPFLLDDTFVQFDDRRLAEAVDYLLELSQTNQVLLFTCHRRELEAARRHQDRVRMIELPAPEPATQE